MSELPGIGLPPSAGEPAPFIRTFPPVEAPPEKPSPPEPSPPPAPPPEEPDTGSVPGLDKLALILLVIGLILAAVAFTDFLNWLLRNTVGKVIRGRPSPKLDHQATTKALSSYLGSFAQSFDAEVGTSFTQMGHTVGMVARIYQEIANDILKLATVVSGLAVNAAGLSVSQNALRHDQQAQKASQHDTNRTTKARLDSQQAREQGIGSHVDELHHHVTDLIEPELTRLKHLIPNLEKGAVDTVKRVSSHDEALGLVAMTGTVAVAMGRLGAGWTRCDNNRALGEAICGANHDTVRKLAHGSLDLLGLIEVCGIVRAIGAISHNPVITGGLGLFSEGVEELLTCTGATLAPPLHTPQAVLAPASQWAALAPVTL